LLAFQFTASPYATPRLSP